MSSLCKYLSLGMINDRDEIETAKMLRHAIFMKIILSSTTLSKMSPGQVNLWPFEQ